MAGGLALVRWLSVAATAFGLLSACSDSGAPDTEYPPTLGFNISAVAGDGAYRFESAYPQLTFDRPVDFAKVPGQPYFAVAEHRGKLRIVEDRPDASQLQMFLDLRDRVLFSGEAGLVRFVFAPDYEVSGRVYLVYLTAEGDAPAPDCAPICAVLSRFTRSPSNPLKLDPDSEEVLLTLPQPLNSHNMGNLLFGPDGMLYVGVGDGGFVSPPRLNAQDRTDLYGTILRLASNGR